MTRSFLRGCSVAALLAMGQGCATTQYAPLVVARGELTLRYDGAYEMSAGGQRVARGLVYKGLQDYVRCVPAAREQAQQASDSGRRAIAYSVLGGVLGASGLIGIGAVFDQQNWIPWLAGGLGLLGIGLTFAILSWRSKNHANGHALDAMNLYNDSVGSLGATCADLTYPPPVGPVPDPGPQPPIQPGAGPGPGFAPQPGPP